jgi:hypothetical protein
MALNKGKDLPMNKSLLRTTLLFTTLLGGSVLSIDTAHAANPAPVTGKITTFVLSSPVPSQVPGAPPVPPPPPSGPYMVFFTLEGGPALCASASGGGNTWVTLTTNYLNHDALKNFLHVINTAKLSGRKVKVRGLDSNVSGEWGCRIDGIDLL